MVYIFLIRNLVEFILRSGDMTIERLWHRKAMQEGSRIHRMIQRRMGSRLSCGGFFAVSL